MPIIKTFESRYDPQYLRWLSGKLNLSYLKRTAIEVERKEKFKHHPKTGKELTKAVKIDLCSLSGTTLLGVVSEEQRADIKSLYPKQAEKIIHLKEEIAQRFELLFQEESLRELNDNDIYLQVRIIFPYLYSDFPCTLIRAEKSKIWDTRMDHEVSFSDTAPLTELEWEKSYLVNSQLNSLKKIGELCVDYPFLSQVNDTSVNTLETRFSVIPTPLCILLINDVAISDSYIYADIPKSLHLAVNTPVNAVGRKVKKTKKGKKELNHTYEMWRKNFLYIWRHDLSLHADMCTKFSPKEPLGLTELRPPYLPGKENTPTINWQIKRDRIIEKKKKLDGTYDPTSENERKLIEEWEKHVEDKLQMNVRKLRVMPNEVDIAQLFIEFNKKGMRPMIEIIYRKESLFSVRLTKKLIHPFCLIVHLAYARLAGVVVDPAFLQSIHKIEWERKKAVKRMLNKKGRIKDDRITDDTLFAALVDSEPKQEHWTFRLSKDHIKFEREKPFRELTYEATDGTIKGCLDGLPPLP